MENPTFLEYTLFNNPLWRILSFFGTIGIFYILGRFAQSFLNKIQNMMAAGHTVANTSIVALQKSSSLLFIAIGLKMAFHFLILSKNLAHLAYTGTDIVFWSALGYLFLNLVEVPIAWLLLLTSYKHSVAGQMLIPSIRRFFQFCVLMVFGTHIMQILSDKPLSSIIAGLGIGGLAIAMAANATISNFFGSLVIFTDKPFELGDCVKIDGQQGFVEEVGMRSTRIRTFSGSLLTVPNADLAVKPIENLSKINYFRRIFNIGLTYDTSLDKVKEAIILIQKLVENHEAFNPEYPPLVYFNEMGDYSLNIYVSIWYYSSDRKASLKFFETLQLDLLATLQSAKINLAFPTQTLIIEKKVD